MRLLLIENEAPATISPFDTLSREGFNVSPAESGEEGLDLAKTYDFDLILLTLDLPDISGTDFVRRLRAAKNPTPVIVLTGANSPEARVRYLSLGADDVITRPYYRDELVERVRAVIRRARGYASPVIQAGPISLDIGRKAISVGGRGIHLTGKEFQIMELLALRKGVVITGEMFMNHLYGGMDEPEIKIIDVFICKIRKRLGAAGKHIETVWGRGYRLVDAPTPRNAPRQPDDFLPDSMRGRIVARLVQGEASERDLRSLSPHWNKVVVGRVLGHLVREGVIISDATGGRLSYRLAARQAA
jgi:two-component system, cell cycle response regulator CtrA